jgi:hypothetical protein
MQNAVILSVKMLNVMKLRVMMQNAVILSVKMMSVVTPSVVMLSVEAPNFSNGFCSFRNEDTSKKLVRGQCYATFYGRKLCLFIIS